MSKNLKAGAAEEEWEDVEEEEEEEEEDTTINNSDVMMKYKRAAQWTNDSMGVVLKAIQPGMTVGDLCTLGDRTMTEKLATAFRGTPKGIAFPTSISVNSCVVHHSPAPGDETYTQKIALNDVVHVDMGIHIDGYSAQAAQTVHVTESGEIDLNTREGKVLHAAHSTLHTALRALRPGMTTAELTSILESLAAHFDVTPVDGVLSHLVKRYIIDGYRCFPQRKVPEHATHDYEIEPAQVWCLDVCLSTNKNKTKTSLKEQGTRPMIYKASLESSYSTKMESARELQREVEEKFQTFPFSLRQLRDPKRARLGLSEMTKHSVVVPYPVLYEKEGEVVGHFKATVLVTGKKIERITGLPLQGKTPPAANAVPFTEEKLQQVAKLSMSFAPKEPKA